MATVCAGSLALFNGGVPCAKPVAGIAMGLIKEGDGVAILSDILGDEDFLGDMDFKVAGSEEGITAFQMDIKIDGISVEIMKAALEQAHRGRLHILGIMNETINAPAEDLSPFAPRYTSIKIPVDCIGAVIGSGGETIRALTKATNTEIKIEDDGTVLVAAVNQEDSDKAIETIMQLTKKPEEGEIYTAKAIDVREGLGVICEFMPGQKGLLHVSQIAWERVENIDEYIKQGDEFEVKLIEVQRDGKYRLSRKAMLPKPEGFVERERPPRDDRDRRDSRDSRGGGRDSRGGGRDSRGGGRDSRGGGRDNRR
jgi:polyribonucleotide nucleotidyltransferase